MTAWTRCSDECVLPEKDDDARPLSVSARAEGAWVINVVRSPTERVGRAVRRRVGFGGHARARKATGREQDGDGAKAHLEPFETILDNRRLVVVWLTRTMRSVWSNTR